MDEPGARPLVLLSLGWSRDRELVGGLLHAAGADSRPTPATPELRRLLAEGRFDLVLADTKGGRGPLDDLLQTLDAVPEAGELPMVLLAEADEVAELAELAIRRPNAVLLAKPVDPGQLRAAVGAGLRYWAGRRRERELMRRLSEANAELRAANAELDRRRAEAEAAHRRHHDLVHGIDAIAWEADAESGRLTFVSQRAEEWFGGPAGRWSAVPDAWLDRVIPDDREYARETRRRGVADGRDFELEYRAEAIDGRTIWVREAARVVRDDQGRPLGLRGLVWDITRRKRVERQLYKAKTALAEQLSDLSHLHRISSELTAASGLEATLEEVLSSAMGLVGAEIGLVRLRDRERGDLEVAASVGLPAEYLDRYRRVPAVVASSGRPVAEHGCVIVPDVDADEAGERVPRARPVGGLPRRLRRAADQPRRCAAGAHRDVLPRAPPPERAPGPPRRALCPAGGRRHRGRPAASRAAGGRPPQG